MLPDATNTSPLGGRMNQTCKRPLQLLKLSVTIVDFVDSWVIGADGDSSQCGMGKAFIEQIWIEKGFAAGAMVHISASRS